MRTLAFLTVFIPMLALADEFHTLVRYSCDAKADQLVIEYHGAYNEAGEELMKSTGADAWSPGDLRGWPPSDPRFSAPKTIIRTCRLSDGDYVFRLKPVPEDFRNVTGRCGDWETGEVRVLKDGQNITDLQLDQSCYDPSAPVVTRVLIKPKQKAPAITKVAGDEFFR